MHTIGDMADVQLFGKVSFVEETEHFSAYAAMDGTHTVNLLWQFAG